MMASGTYSAGIYSFNGSVDWLAIRLEEKSAGVWEGEIVSRFGNKQLLPHNLVRIHVPRQIFAVSGSRMTITFTGGAPDISRVLEFESPYFRTVEFEFDTVETAPRVTTIDTWVHPVRPSNLRREQLNIAEVYSRVGVDVQQSPNTSVVGLEAGVGAEKWTNQELHDSMQVFWSRYKPRAQWAVWMLFAHRHVDPTLGGIMFDDSKRNPKDRFQRQGAAVFGDTLADRLPDGEKQPKQWIRRQRFFTAVHEIGHCFNLLHSWEKYLGDPWVATIPTDRQARSFMNYPQDIENFFKSFHYRFDDPELIFIRHAPEEFVEMGAAAAGANHGFRNGRFAANPRLALELAVSRARPVFEFLEPIAIELRLTNICSQPQLVNSSVLDEVHDLTLIIQPRGGLAQDWRPYARHCSFGGVKLLQPRESLTASLFVSAGLGGWYLAEPGSYTLHACLHSHGGAILAEPLSLRVASPRSREEDYLAQNFFTNEVGRALAFGGTYVMTSAIEALQEAADRLKGRAVARHAMLALALKTPRRIFLRVMVEKNPSTAVSHDAEVGVKWQVHRGWSASHLKTLGCLCVA